MSAIFKSRLYSTFSNSTIMNKNKQVIHSKLETISVIFTHLAPLLQYLSAPQNIVWLIWPNRKFQKLLPLRVKTLLITSRYVSQFWFLKLTKQIKFKFRLCMILRYKAFLTVLVNIYIIYFWTWYKSTRLQWAHSPGHSFVRLIPGEELS